MRQTAYKFSYQQPFLRQLHQLSIYDTLKVAFWYATFTLIGPFKVQLSILLVDVYPLNGFDTLTTFCHQ